MSTVCAAALLRCLVDLDVLYDKVSGIETLGVGIGLSVLKKTEKELGGLDWPSGAGNTELLSWSLLESVVARYSLKAYLEQHDQFLRHNVSLGQPPCAPERSPRT